MECVSKCTASFNEPDWSTKTRTNWAIIGTVSGPANWALPDIYSLTYNLSKTLPEWLQWWLGGGEQTPQWPLVAAALRRLALAASK